MVASPLGPERRPEVVVFRQPGPVDVVECLDAESVALEDLVAQVPVRRGHPRVLKPLLRRVEAQAVPRDRHDRDGAAP